MVVRRGEIWWANLPDPVGSEPGYRRPVLILQADRFCESALRTVVCVGITSNIALAMAPGNVHLPSRESGLPKASVVNVTQIMTLDKNFLLQKIRSLNAAHLSLVEDGIRLSLDL